MVIWLIQNIFLRTKDVFFLRKELRLIFINSRFPPKKPAIKNILDVFCMVYLPKFTPKTTQVCR